MLKKKKKEFTILVRVSGVSYTRGNPPGEPEPRKKPLPVRLPRGCYTNNSSKLNTMLPSLRQIFAAFRSPEQEADLSRTAFSRFLLYILTVTSLSLIASKAVQNKPN
ncbi:hypothetical protein VP01_701g3 [Puccinia sorghi]|uniref:Uncharacterized protein n=1 Tax=Puccinia sorghi TaxID=27349 RepID=A0A0L6UEM5_9BASI|nr:hypothetical protein VP01_701g3 [Puccinia sorghi]